MLRRAASGHIEATQLSKLAAACRIALAVISGWPEAASSPLHGNGVPLPPGDVCGCAGEVEFGSEKMLPNRSESPPPGDCAQASPPHISAAARIAAPVRLLAAATARPLLSQPRFPFAHSVPSVASCPTRTGPNYPALSRPRRGFQ